MEERKRVRTNAAFFFNTSVGPKRPIAKGLKKKLHLQTIEVAAVEFAVVFDFTDLGESTLAIKADGGFVVGVNGQLHLLESNVFGVLQGLLQDLSSESPTAMRLMKAHA